MLDQVGVETGPVAGFDLPSVQVLKHAEEVGDLLNMRQSKLNPKKAFHETELFWTNDTW